MAGHYASSSAHHHYQEPAIAEPEATATDPPQPTEPEEAAGPVPVSELPEDGTLLSDLLDPVLDTIEALAKGHTLGLTTGFPELDALTGGLQPGTLTVIASRPAVGRTTLLTDFCRHTAIKNGFPVAVFSLEETREDFTMRVLAAEARVPRHYLRSGTLRDDDWSRLAHCIRPASEAPLYLSAPPSLTTAALSADARQLHEQHGVKLIAIDGIQDLLPRKRNDLREREVGDAVRDLKRLARELHVPIVATSHLNRGAEQRADRKPALDDLRESGAITFAADTIILLHREDAYDRDTPRVGEADFLVVKNRQSRTATLVTAFQGHYGRFVHVEGGF